jgi:hypothetical protein
MMHVLPILNYADIVSQTMSFTIAYTWRESIRDFLKGLCPPALVEGPTGAIIFAIMLTLFIIVATMLIENVTNINRHLYEFKKRSSLKYDKEESDLEENSS